MYFKQNKPSVRSSGLCFAGIYISSTARKLEAALAEIESPEPGSAITLRKSMSFDLPEDISSAFAEIRESLDQSRRSSQGVGGHRGTADALSQLLMLRLMIAAIEEEAVGALLSDAGASESEVAAVAVSAPGIVLPPGQLDDRPSIISAASSRELAGRLGINVIDSFAPSSGPFSESEKASFLLPWWILLSNTEKDRLVIDLGEMARWYYIPAGTASGDSWKGACFAEVAPCGALLSRIFQEGVRGDEQIDVGGQRSVQGQKSQELFDAWLAAEDNLHAENAALLPGVESHYVEALKKFGRKISSNDALCTAAHFIASRLEESLGARTNAFSPSCDVVITGGARQNRLLHTLTARLFDRKTSSFSETGFNEDSFDAVAVAALGILFAGRVPAALPEISGVQSPELLGRITPGSLQAWNSFLTRFRP